MWQGVCLVPVCRHVRSGGTVVPTELLALRRRERSARTPDLRPGAVCCRGPPKREGVPPLLNKARAVSKCPLQLVNAYRPPNPPLYQSISTVMEDGFQTPCLTTSLSLPGPSPTGPGRTDRQSSPTTTHPAPRTAVWTAWSVRPAVRPWRVFLTRPRGQADSHQAGWANRQFEAKAKASWIVA